MHEKVFSFNDEIGSEANKKRKIIWKKSMMGQSWVGIEYDVGGPNSLKSQLISKWQSFLLKMSTFDALMLTCR